MATATTRTTLSKSDVVRQMAEQCNTTQKQANEALDAFFETIQNAFRNGSNVKFVGFGEFKVSRSEAHKGLNPRTKEAIQIPARNRATFSAGAKLKKAANRS